MVTVTSPTNQYLSVSKRMCAACEIGDHMDLQSLLLECSVEDINKCNSGSTTPIWIACVGGYDKCVSLLIAAGADVNASDLRGINPLSIACQRNHSKCVSQLIAAGADVNASDFDGISVVFIACTYGHDRCLSQLIAAGADVNTNIDGYTPMCIAALLGMLDCVLLLIRHGVDITAGHTISEESVTNLYGRFVATDGGDSSDDLRVMTYATRQEHIVIIEDAYKRECKWRRRKDYMTFAHGMMQCHYSNRWNSFKDTHMIKAYTVFGMRHVHESVVSYV